MAMSFCTGYEHGVSPVSQNGTGLSSSSSGNPVLVTSPVHSGTYALNLNTDGVTAQYIRHFFAAAATPTIGVARVYFSASAWNGTNSWACVGTQITTSATLCGIQVNSNGQSKISLTGASDINGPLLNLNQWYLFEIKVNVSGATWSVDWSVDGAAQTQISSGGHAADTLSYVRLGSSTSTFNSGVFYFDDFASSTTSGDYPLGAGYTLALVPGSDGTHVAGTNIMENQAGADIGVVTAFNLINKIPMTGTTTYIQQLGNGTGNYAEVLFGDFPIACAVIQCTTALLAYTSATTTSNNGGCILSIDSFSSSFTLWGAPGALSDYSDGSLTNLFYKNVNISTANSVASVNLIKARMGYSGDAAPDPYWINIMVEVAYYPIEKILNINQSVNRSAVI